MRTSTLRPTTSFECLVVAGIFFSLPFCAVQAQTGTQEECKANECFSPAFEVGVVSPSLIGQYGITALMYAVEINDLARVEALLASKVDVDAQNESGATALLMAAAYGSSSIVARLLAAGADPDIASDRGDTPLASAIHANHIDIAVALLDSGADPTTYHNPYSARSRTDALVAAAVRGQTDVVELLLKLGVDTPESALEALSLALWKHHESVVALLLETDIDLNAPTYDTKKHKHMQTGELVLHTAAQEGLQLSTTMLLEKGADVNGRSVHGSSALYFAIRANHPEIARLLLDAGARVVGDDLLTALHAGNDEVVSQLKAHLDVFALDIAEIDALIVKADEANDSELLNMLFIARDGLKKSEAVSSLLFAIADMDDCELVRWDMAVDRQITVFASPGECHQSFYFSKSRSELYVVDDQTVRVISLDAPESGARLIKLPTSMINENLSALAERLSISFRGHDTSWMKARVVQAGVLESGEFAIVTHSSGPADGTYGYLYSLVNDSWRLVRSADCHRFDPCYFDEVLSHSLHERPNSMTAWSPELRRNPYFVDKTETTVMEYEHIRWDGVITLSIDGQHSRLHYGKGESGHCAGDCVYSNGLSLALPGRDTVKIAKVGGNNAIVDRYALVWTGRPNRSALIDLGTGKSVFGEFQVASWLH